MSIYSQLYWLTRLDSIFGLFVTASLLIAVILAVKFMLWTCGDDDDCMFETKSTGWILFSIMCLTIIIACLIPTKKEVIFIVAGGKTIEYIEKDTSISKIPGQSTALLSKYLENELKQMSSDTVKHTTKDVEKVIESKKDQVIDDDMKNIIRDAVKKEIKDQIKGN